MGRIDVHDALNNKMNGQSGAGSSQGFADIDSVQIEISENIGDEVEPIIKSRFKSIIYVANDLYKNKEYILKKAVLEKVTPKGTEVKLYGIATSKYNMEKWDISFDKMKFSLAPDGNKLSRFPLGSYVIAGSPEHIQLIEQAKEQEEKRKKEEAERKLLAEKKKKEDREIILSVVKSNSIVSGEAGDRRKKWPFKLTFENYDESKNTFSGKMEWPTLKGITEIKGNIIGNNIVFKEIAHIKRGSVSLNTTYEMGTVKDKKISGLWNRRQSNWIWFSIM